MRIRCLHSTGQVLWGKEMADFSEWMADLKQMRDELRLHLHLGAKEAEEEWDGLMKDWDAFLSNAQFEKSEEEIGEAAREPVSYTHLRAHET